MLYTPLAPAADRYWDSNGGAAGSGGTGTWDTVSPYWNAAADGVAGPFYTWDNTAIDSAIFAGTPGIVTLGGPITANALTFNTAGYTLTGGTLTLAGATPAITTNSDATVDSTIAGSAGFTKAGSAALTLNGANTFTGDVTVTGGTFNVASDAALGAAANGITMGAGTSLYAGGALAASRVVTLTGGTVTLSGA